VAKVWQNRYVAASPDEQIARVAYDAYHAALEGAPPGWEELDVRERLAWRAAVAAATDLGDQTVAQNGPLQSLVVEVGDQTRAFSNEFTAGRQGSLRITDEHASGQHALFQFAHGHWYVEDLNSTNGTYLNGRRCFAAQRLRKGDKVRIGHTTLIVVSA
jgi:pSer/pThr/pTyr-binding forkhead associated (FHA) protein